MDEHHIQVDAGIPKPYFKEELTWRCPIPPLQTSTLVGSVPCLLGILLVVAGDNNGSLLYFRLN